MNLIVRSAKHWKRLGLLCVKQQNQTN